MSNQQDIPTHDGWNHRWGCPPITSPKKSSKKEIKLGTCTECNGHLRIRIKKDGTIEEYGNNTTIYGGIFCSTGCSIYYIQKHEKIEKNITEKISINIKYDNKNGNPQGEYAKTEYAKTESTKKKETKKKGSEMQSPKM